MYIFSYCSVIKFLNLKQVDVYLNEQTPRQPSKRRRVSPGKSHRPESKNV